MFLLLCWASMASGKQTAWHLHSANCYFSQVDSYFAQSLTDVSSISVMQLTGESERSLSRKSNTRKLTALLRGHLKSCSEQGRIAPTLPDASLPAHSDTAFFDVTRQYRDKGISLALLRTLQLPPHQNRLGGWKESNILYRGKLTYDQPDAEAYVG